MNRLTGFNLTSFSNSKDIISKGEETVKMKKKEFVDEHKNLVDVLNSPSHKDDKKEAKKQEKELNEIEKDKKGLWDNVHAKRERGEKPAKPGDDDYPDTEAFKEASKSKIKKSENMDNTLQGSIGKEELVKGHISWNFGNTQQVSIDKKGSEIKEKLKTLREKEQLECTQYQTRLEALKAVIPTEPTETISEYVTDGVDVTIMPKKYNWSECYCNEEKVTDMEGKEVKSEAQILCDSKREYNNNAEEFVKCQVELHLIDTMTTNLDDNKIYNLSVKQAAILGF